MANYSCLVIMNGENEIDIDSQLKELTWNHSSLKRIDPYIALKSDEVIEKYNKYKENKDEFLNIEDFIVKWCGFDKIDKYGNAISTSNYNAKLDSYLIGGIYKGTLIDKENAYVNVVKVKNIDWKATLKKSISRSKRNWKEAKRNHPLLAKTLYGIDEFISEDQYIQRSSYNILDSVIDKNGNFYNIKIDSEKEWTNNFYNKFIKNLNPKDTLVLIDCFI